MKEGRQRINVLCVFRDEIRSLFSIQSRFGITIIKRRTQLEELVDIEISEEITKTRKLLVMLESAENRAESNVLLPINQYVTRIMSKGLRVILDELVSVLYFRFVHRKKILNFSVFFLAKCSNCLSRLDRLK